MKFISWNVNGLRAVAGKGFADIFTELDADFFCLQETKLQGGQIDLEFLGYHSFWNYAEKKGYSGTCIYTRMEPLAVSYGLELPEIGAPIISEHSCKGPAEESQDRVIDTEGRVITLEMSDFYLVCVYTPNSQDGLRRLPYRMQWEDAFREYLGELAKRKGVIVCGDMNVAHEEIDLKNPDTNHFNAGFSDEERGKMTELLGSGFADSFRALYPDKVEYSWWSYRMKARERNVGWRIDYFLVSESLRSHICAASIHGEIFGSDHCPVELVLRDGQTD